MFEFVAKLRGREGIFFLRRQCVQEVFDITIQDNNDDDLSDADQSLLDRISKSGSNQSSAH